MSRYEIGCYGANRFEIQVTEVGATRRYAVLDTLVDAERTVTALLEYEARIARDAGPVKKIVKVDPEPFPLGHPENAPEEPSKRELEPVPAGASLREEPPAP